MIKLNKQPEPHILVTNGPAWTKQITDKAARGVKLTDIERTRYRHPDIKSALIAETAEKCAYCESKLLHVHHGDVEHIIPKSLVPEKTVEWNNLTLACEICNQNKSNLDPRAEHIIDPYAIDPSLHLTFAGALMLAKGTTEGTSTRAILDFRQPLP